MARISPRKLQNVNKIYQHTERNVPIELWKSYEKQEAVTLLIVDIAVIHCKYQSESLL